MNLNYLFYKDYFNEEWPNLGERKKGSHDAILSAIVKETDDELEFTSPKTSFGLDAKSFQLKTVYPGLLIGLGYSHDPVKIKKDVQNNEQITKDTEAIQLGFSLDYTTGLPIIPGSTVKGVIKSGLRNYYFDEEEYKKKYQKCFGTKEKQGRVVFLDAVPIKSKYTNKLFSEEFITPHGKDPNGEEDPLKSPNPLRLLKVIPDVVYCFRFLNIAEAELDLFKDIITTLGIGAKTNVGFGIMEAVDEIDPTWLKIEISDPE